MGRRVKILRVSRELLADIFKQNLKRQVVIVEGLPEDARLVGISDQDRFTFDVVSLKFESDEWPEVPEGRPIDEIKLMARTIDFAGIIGDALQRGGAG